MEEGIVYLLTNPSMPSLVKIGMTTRNEVHVRMGELYSTGVPLPFLSYGGSSMFATLIGFGLLQNVHARHR